MHRRTTRQDLEDKAGMVRVGPVPPKPMVFNNVEEIRRFGEAQGTIADGV